jgi:uncharacterized protein
MMLTIPEILRRILDGYQLPLNGDHGVAHWARVYENGMRLAPETGADAELVGLFAVLHDSRRWNEGHDPEHGDRAAQFALELLHEVDGFDLRLRTLLAACEGHTRERTHPDATIQTCWDADRLDLGRVGITPDPHWLSTEAAKRRDTIAWADGRARFHVVPGWVRANWGVDLS